MSGYEKVPPIAGGNTDVWRCTGDLCGALVRKAAGKKSHDKAFHPERLPLTPTMVRVLRNIRDHDYPFARGFHGLSEHGGAGSALRALDNRGLVDGWKLTDLGRQALADHEAREGTR